MNHFPDKKEREIVFANPPPQKKDPKIIAKPEPPSPRVIDRPGTTYYELANRDQPDQSPSTSGLRKTDLDGAEPPSRRLTIVPGL